MEEIKKSRLIERFVYVDLFIYMPMMILKFVVDHAQIEVITKA